MIRTTSTTSLPVAALAVCAVVCALLGLLFNLRESKKARELREDLRARFPAAWGRIPWVQRVVLSPRYAARRLQRSGELPAAEYHAAVAPLRRLQRAKRVCAASGIVCLALMLIGARYWGWAL